VITFVQLCIGCWRGSHTSQVPLPVPHPAYHPSQEFKYDHGSSWRRDTGGGGEDDSACVTYWRMGVVAVLSCDGLFAFATGEQSTPNAAQTNQIKSNQRVSVVREIVAITPRFVPGCNGFRLTSSISCRPLRFTETQTTCTKTRLQLSNRNERTTTSTRSLATSGWA
jgi:hypothetical protein